jgi:hypothetical protein
MDSADDLHSCGGLAARLVQEKIVMSTIDDLKAMQKEMESRGLPKMASVLSEAIKGIESRDNHIIHLHSLNSKISNKCKEALNTIDTQLAEYGYPSYENCIIYDRIKELYDDFQFVVSDSLTLDKQLKQSQKGYNDIYAILRGISDWYGENGKVLENYPGQQANQLDVYITKARELYKQIALRGEPVTVENPNVDQ